MRDRFGIFGAVIRIRKLSLLLVVTLRIPNKVHEKEQNGPLDHLVRATNHHLKGLFGSLLRGTRFTPASQLASFGQAQSMQGRVVWLAA